MPTVCCASKGDLHSGSRGGYLARSLFLEKQRVIDKFVGRDRNAFLPCESDHGTVPVFKLARLPVADIPLHRGGSVCGHGVQNGHRVGDDRRRQSDLPGRSHGKHFVHTSLSSRRVSGLARIAPIGALVTAPTPPNEVMIRNFSQSALCISGGISTVTPVFRNASCNCAVRSLRRLSSSPNLM